MGDARFSEPLVRVKQAQDRLKAIEDLTYEELVLALGAASKERDPFLANVLATGLLNRSRRGAAFMFSAGLGVAATVVLFALLAGLLATHPHNFNDHLFLLAAFVALAAGMVGALLSHSSILQRLMERRA